MVGDANVDDGLWLETKASKLGESASHAGAGRRWTTVAPDVETEGVEETNDEMLSRCGHGRAPAIKEKELTQGPQRARRREGEKPPPS